LDFSSIVDSDKAILPIDRKKSFKSPKFKKSNFKRGIRESSAPRAEGPLGKALLAKKQALPYRQQQGILACLVNHPNLLYSHEEVLDRFEFQAELDKLRQELQKITSLGVDLDLDAVHTHFKECGKGDLLDCVLTKQVYLLVFQARPDASEEEASELIEHFLLLRTQGETANEMSDGKLRSRDLVEDAKETRTRAIHSSFTEGERMLYPNDKEIE